MAQNWQPMHLSLSICTVPSSVTCDAWVGHTFTHSGSSQCWHWMGRKYISTSGQSPEPPSLGVGPMRSVLIQKSPGITPLMVLQAAEQAWQPTQRFRSVTIA